jgi:hyperosmotically inducible protein
MNPFHRRRIANAAMASALSGVLALSLAACGDASNTSNTSNTAASAPQSSTVGEVIDDTVLSTRIKSALMANPQINSYDFKLATRNGDVLLSGFVDSQAQINLAMDTVRAVDGVKSVQNNMTIKTGSPTVGNKVDDGITTARVKAALLADTGIRSLDIRVVTRVGTVQLSGFVNNQAQMDHATQLAAGVQGVLEVSNEMQIKQ